MRQRSGDVMDALLSALKAVAEPTRLRLLAVCGQAELTVTELTIILGQSQPRISRHLKLLCDAGLLERSREGVHAFFRLARRGDHAALAQRLIDSLPADNPDLVLDRERLSQIRQQRVQQAQHYFERNARNWQEIRAMYVPEQDIETALLELVPQGTGDLIDIGTGTGRMLEIFAPRVRDCVGIDLSREMLAVARINLEQPGMENCQVRQGDMDQLPVPGRHFDVAIMHQVLHYAEEPVRALAEAARVLRPGGRLIIVDFAAHDRTELLEEHAHRWAGFEDSDVARWCAEAGIAPAQPIRFAGQVLDVVIWHGVRQGDMAHLPAGEALTGNQETGIQFRGIGR